MQLGSEKAEINYPFWLEMVPAEELPEVYREIAREIGAVQAYKLAALFAGSSVYFPKLERALRDQRNQLIRGEYTGTNLKQLARRWKLSVRHLRDILSEPKNLGH